MNTLFVIIAISLSHGLVHAAIRHPVSDLLNLSASEDPPVRAGDILAFSCDLDRDGIEDFFLSNGVGLRDRAQSCFWHFYHGLRDGGYERFDEAIPIGTDDNYILFFPRVAEVGELAGQTEGYGLITYVDYPGESEELGGFIHQYLYTFSDGKLKRKLVAKEKSFEHLDRLLEKSKGIDVVAECRRRATVLLQREMQETSGDSILHKSGIDPAIDPGASATPLPTSVPEVSTSTFKFGKFVIITIAILSIGFLFAVWWVAKRRRLT